MPRADAVRVAREFAENADKTHGKSMIFLGAGTNHWYHSDMIYRSIINLTTLCGCQGVNGGGWAHYVGQEKVRPQAAWSQLAFGLDWTRPPRQQNGTSFYYFATDQWRYDTFNAENILSPLAGPGRPRHMADYNAIAVRLGWLPSFPQFNRNPLDICREAVEKGAATDAEIVAHAVEQLKDGSLRFAIDDPDHPDNFPRMLFLWRANLLGASGKGHEYFLKHLLGAENAVLNAESTLRPEEIHWREPAPEGKLDLLVTLELRMSTSAMYSDIALPAAGWYEMHDLSTTDMHSFIHPFNPAVDPPWEAKTSWNQFAAIAEKFSELAAVHLGEMKDLVATPLLHDSPGEITQAEILDWRKGETEAVPGRTMPQLSVITRDFPNAYKMMTALGPLVHQVGVGSKGVVWSGKEEYAELAAKLGTVTAPGKSHGMPSSGHQQAGGRGNPAAGARDQRRNRGQILGRAREEDRPCPFPPERGAARRKNNFCRYHGPAPEDHHLAGMERHRIGNPAVFALRDQYRGKGAVQNAHRPGPVLSGPPLDARFRRGAPSLPAAP